MHKGKGLTHSCFHADSLQPATLQSCMHAGFLTLSIVLLRGCEVPSIQHGAYT